MGWGLNRFNVATILALTSAAVQTHNLFSPHEGVLTHQCYISENTKNQLITEIQQREGLDSTKQLKCWSKRKPTFRRLSTIEGKAMIRNRNNCPTPPIRDIKGKETQTLNKYTLIETSLAKSQTDSYFPTSGQMAIENKNM